MAAVPFKPRATAAYYRVYLVLRQRLMDWESSSRTPLPGEHSLAKEFGVSRSTIRRALDLLHREKCIIRRQGVGNFPAPAGPRSSREPVPTPGVGHLITLTKGTRAKNLSQEILLPPARVRDALKLRAGDYCLLLRRLRLLKARPFSLTAIYVPTAIADQLDLRRLKGTPIVHALEAAGLAPKRAIQMLNATLSDAAVAEHLGGAIGAPVMRLRRTVFDAEEHPLMYQESLYLSQYFELRMELNRDHSDASVLWQPTKGRWES